jgi:hypothetical protein
LDYDDEQDYYPNEDGEAEIKEGEHNADEDYYD